MDCHLGFLVLEILLIVGFDGDNMLRFFVLGSSDNGKGTLPNLQTYLELVQLQRLTVWILPSPPIYNLSEVSQRIQGLLSFEIPDLVFPHLLSLLSLCSTPRCDILIVFIVGSCILLHKALL